MLVVPYQYADISFAVLLHKLDIVLILLTYFMCLEDFGPSLYFFISFEI
jgi:hypothetical protein